MLKKIIKCIVPSFIRSKIWATWNLIKGENTVSREFRIRKGIDKNQIGLEIGPSHHPIVPRKDGYHVEIIDWLSQQDLKEHYKGHGVDLEAIEEVDYVWKGGSYSELTGKKEYYDYIIASHMIEHTTDFLGFLQDCSNMLKNNGILRLAVSDKRYCFDHFRDLTGLAEVLNNYYFPDDIQTIGTVTEYHLNVVAYKKKISWNKCFGWFSNLSINDKHYTFVHSLEDVKSVSRLVREKREYRDIHHYVFTPTSFELLVTDLRMLGLLNMEIIEKTPTKGNEFLITMQKNNEAYLVDAKCRKRMLRKRNRENRI